MEITNIAQLEPVFVKPYRVGSFPSNCPFSSFPSFSLKSRLQLADFLLILITPTLVVESREKVETFGVSKGFSTRKEGLPLILIHDGVITGGLAGVAVDMALYPIDTIKTRLQTVRGGGEIILKVLY